MGFAFSETMAGTIEWDAKPGAEQPFEFSVTATAESTRAHLRDGVARLAGTVTSPGLATAADCEGTIIIRPVGQKIIRYELSFLGDDGRPYELVGQKDIKYRHLLRTMTYLPAELLDEDHRRVATCKTSFDLRGDGLRFLRSFRSI